VLFAGCGCLLLGFQGCAVPAPSEPAGAEAPPEPAGAEAPPARARAAEGKVNTAREAVAAPFRLPDDAGGALLGRVLPPRLPRGPLKGPVRERRAPAAPDLEAPGLAWPRPDGRVPHLPARRAPHSLRPHLVLEEELPGAPDTPAVPRRPAFHAGERARVRSDDPHLPPPLPILAQPVPDRASLEDATTEMSTEAVLAAPLPRRTAPAPYQRLAVPDPYEHRRPLRLPVPAEGAAPQAGPPRLPKP
jgi:hypothetical protein